MHIVACLGCAACSGIGAAKPPLDPPNVPSNGRTTRPIVFAMLNRLPRHVGSFDEVCRDLGITGQYRQIAKALGVHERTVRRWKNHGAPRTAMLALWWLSREGYSMWAAEMHNREALAVQYAAALARDGRLRLDGAGDPLGVIAEAEPANDRFTGSTTTATSEARGGSTARRAA